MIKLSQMSQTKAWWYEAKDALQLFSSLINSPLRPMSYQEQNHIVKTLKAAYRDIQRISAVDLDDDLYTFTTQAVLNLWMAYEEYASGEEKVANTYLTIARTNAIRLIDRLVSYGIIEIFGSPAYK